MSMGRKKKSEAVETIDASNVHPSLAPLSIDLGTLVLDPNNARGHGEANIDAIAHSLKEFGQRKPIIVKRTGMVVIAGNGTLIAAKRLGWTKIAALVTDDDEMTAKAFALADNRTGELASWDYQQLVAQFNELHNAGHDVQGLGWDELELKTLMQLGDQGFDDMQRLDVDATLTNAPTPQGVGKKGKCEKNEQWFYIEFYKDEEEFNRLVEKLKPHMRTEHEITSETFSAMVDAFIANRVGKGV